MTMPRIAASAASAREPLVALMRRLENVERDARELRAALTLNSAQVTSGGLEITGGGSVQVKGGGGVLIQNGGSFSLQSQTATTVVLAGTTDIPDGSGRQQAIFALFRDDGTPAMAMADYGPVLNHPHQQAWAFYDRNGNTVLAEDTVSGLGLAAPNLLMGQWVSLSVPTDTTTSSSYAAMAWADVIQQQPRVQTSVLVNTPSGTTGQIRITVGGAQIASASVPAATFTVFTLGPASWPGGYTPGTETTVQLEARVTAGGGAIGVRGMSIVGFGS